MENSYSLKEVIEEFRRDTENSLGRIEAQTTKTNGRVSSLETSRTKIWTTIAVLLLLGGTIITLTVMAIRSEIQSTVKSVLSSYNITAE